MCPFCGDSKIRKAVMAPSLGRSNPEPQSDHPEYAIRQYAAGLRDYIRQNAEYVGARFADEARKIHNGEVDERQIYGESTLAEVKELIEEGIDVAPFPVDPEEMN